MFKTGRSPLPDPTAIEEGMGRLDGTLWKAAMEAEIAGLEKRGVWGIIIDESTVPQEPTLPSQRVLGKSRDQPTAVSKSTSIV